MKTLLAAVLAVPLAASAGTPSGPHGPGVVAVTTGTPSFPGGGQQGSHSAQGGVPTKKQCKSYNKGGEIYLNLTKRYYQNYTPSSPTDNVGLHATVLHFTGQDAKDGSSILNARMREKGDPTTECRPVHEAGGRLSAALAELGPIADQAKTICTTFPETQNDVRNCAQGVRPLFEKHRSIKADGGPLASFLSVYGGKASCLNFTEDERLLFQRLRKEPLERDARGEQKRIGKMREAHLNHLSKIKDVPVLRPMWEGQKRLILGGSGGACPGSDAGAEHIMWCLRDHPEIDNEYLFAGSAKVAAAFHVINSYECPE